jgi:hypothetical protein
MSAFNPEEEFTEKVRKTLDAGVEGLDPGIQSRLNRMRNEALEKAAGKKSSFWFLFRKPVAGLVAASVLLLITTLYLEWPSQTPPVNSIEDIEILSSVDNIDFYENLDFFFWLADEHKNAG